MHHQGAGELGRITIGFEARGTPGGGLGRGQLKKAWHDGRVGWSKLCRRISESEDLLARTSRSGLVRASHPACGSIACHDLGPPRDWWEARTCLARSTGRFGPVLRASHPACGSIARHDLGLPRDGWEARSSPHIWHVAPAALGRCCVLHTRCVDSSHAMRLYHHATGVKHAAARKAGLLRARFRWAALGRCCVLHTRRVDPSHAMRLYHHATGGKHAAARKAGLLRAIRRNRPKTCPAR
jgi:hypothetical protein